MAKGPTRSGKRYRNTNRQDAVVRQSPAYLKGRRTAGDILGNAIGGIFSFVPIPGTRTMRVTIKGLNYRGIVPKLEEPFRRRKMETKRTRAHAERARLKERRWKTIQNIQREKAAWADDFRIMVGA